MTELEHKVLEFVFINSCALLRPRQHISEEVHVQTWLNASQRNVFKAGWATDNVSFDLCACRPSAKAKEGREAPLQAIR